MRHSTGTGGRFYVVDRRHGLLEEFGAEGVPVAPQYGGAPRCPVCGRCIGMKKWLPPYKAQLQIHGSRLGDVAYFTPPDLAVSEHFKDSFERAGLIGLQFHRLDLTRATPLRSHPGRPFYYTPIARGRAAIDVGGSELERGPVLCPECRTMMQVERASRVVLEEGSWDGLDIFTARGLPGTAIVSQKFKEMCDSERLVGLTLKPAEEYAFDGMPWTKGPPGVPTQNSIIVPGFRKGSGAP